MSGFVIPAYARRPRVRALVRGASTDGSFANIGTGADASATLPLIEAGGAATNHYRCASFDATFSLTADPAHGLLWWGQQTDLILELQIGFLSYGAPDTAQPDAWTSMIVGQVDHVAADPNNGTVKVEGRDLAARLIDAKTQEAFTNKTSSEVIAALAGRHGLTSDVTRTTTPVGRYYQLQHDTLTGGEMHRATNEWDLAAFLAQHEGFDLWVDGTTLHFHPTQPATSPARRINYLPRSYGRPFPVSDQVSLHLERALTLAKDIQVTVQSWNSKTGRQIVKTVRAIGAKAASKQTASTQKGVATQGYVFTRPNLTEDAALKLANQILQDISQHERVIRVELIPDPTWNPRQRITLTGTGSSWDQDYWIDELRWEIGADRFSQSLTAKNHFTETEPVIS